MQIMDYLFRALIFIFMSFFVLIMTLFFINPSVPPEIVQREDNKIESISISKFMDNIISFKRSVFEKMDQSWKDKTDSWKK